MAMYCGVHKLNHINHYIQNLLVKNILIVLQSWDMENIELDIISNGMNGEGIARYNGKVYFVDGVIIGEKVVAKVVKENKNFCYAQVETLLTKSENRCQPKCEYYQFCGGCNLQHIKYEKQLDIKTQNVQNLFNKHKLNANVCMCQGGQEFEYRNKITMYLSKNNKLGFYKENSNQICEINHCYLINNDFNNLIVKLNNFFKANKEFNPLILKGLSIRQIDNKYIINLILTKKIILTKLQNYLKLNKINYVLYYCINNKKNSNIPEYPCHYVDGEEKIYSNEYDIKYPVFPMSFLQVNNHIKKLVYDEIISRVKDCNNVIDAYSGAGLLSAILAKNNKNIVAVEIDESASKSCELLCKQNNINNVKSICGDCVKVLPQLLQEEMYDFIILDPARAGVDQHILTEIVKYKIPNILYLSCNPATLTRDLELLTNGCYKISFVKPYDMFPQTSNVETLVQLKLDM